MFRKLILKKAKKQQRVMYCFELCSIPCVLLNTFSPYVNIDYLETWSFVEWYSIGIFGH